MKETDITVKVQGVLMPLVQVGLMEGPEGWAEDEQDPQSPASGTKSYRTGGCDSALRPSSVSVGLSFDHHEL